MVKTATWTSGEPTSRSPIANSLINSAFLLALIDIVSFFNFGAKAGMSSSLRRLLDCGHSTGVVRIYYIGTDAQAFVLVQLIQLRSSSLWVGSPAIRRIRAVRIRVRDGLNSTATTLYGLRFVRKQSSTAEMIEATLHVKLGAVRVIVC